jgi:hypothetical protein
MKVAHTPHCPEYSAAHPRRNVHAVASRTADTMALDPEDVTAAADAYQSRQPMAAVEDEHREFLPDLLASGEFGWRDPEWVVQWFYRRHLGTYPDRERREREDAYGENDYEAVQRALTTAASADETREKLDALTALDGVDVPVASAFLAFCHPDRYLVCSEREWRVLYVHDELARPYPRPPTATDYERYLDVAREVAERCGCSLPTLARACWVLGADDESVE